MTLEPSMPIHVRLELDLSRQPLQGTLLGPSGVSQPFVGWLGLTAALEGLGEAPTAPEPQAGR